MKLATLTTCGLMAVAVLAISPAANASGLSQCIKMGNQVSEALQNAKPGPATEDARAYERAGRNFCSQSMYEKGIKRYKKALELLGKN